MLQYLRTGAASKYVILVAAAVIVICAFKYYNKSHSHIHLLTNAAFGERKTNLGKCTKADKTSPVVDESVVQANFEVFGKVQGVFFRKHAKEKADSLGVRGWIKNSANGAGDTVVGQIEGARRAVDEMKIWLREVGSPASKISRAKFSNEFIKAEPTFDVFQIKQ